MSRCSMTEPGSPVLRLHTTGGGEDAVRMEKRMHCAARALGLDVWLEWGVRGFGTTDVTVVGQLLIDHLVSTEQLESLLPEYLEPEE